MPTFSQATPRLPVDSLKRTTAIGLHELLKARVPIEWGPEVYAYGRPEFAIRDLGGYVIIFTEPTDDPPTTSDSEPEEGA
jgi:hypothetical protein